MFKYLVFILLLASTTAPAFAIQAPLPAIPEDWVVASPPDTNPKKHDITSILALVVLFLLPYLGIHRVLMGGSYWLIVGYIVSLGGFFGLLPLMDFFRILLEPEHYRGNSKFLAAFGFM